MDGGDWEPTPLPLGLDQVVQLGQAGGIEVASAVVELADGELILVWERFDEPFSEGGLWTSKSADLSSWTAPISLEIGTSTYEASPSILSLNGTFWLYFIETDGLRQRGAQCLSGCPSNMRR